jgi:hypothetical protein
VWTGTTDYERKLLEGASRKREEERNSVFPHGGEEMHVDDTATPPRATQTAPEKGDTVRGCE